MKNIKLSIAVILLLMFGLVHAAEFWVGESAQCNQSNHYDTLNLALLQAITNGSENDQIILTDQADYTGEVNGDYILTNWNSGGNGALTIIGGFANCDGTLSDRTFIGDNTKDIFDISDNSTVTLRNLQVSMGEKRGIKIAENSTVILENVDVWFNQSGVSVGSGSFLSVNTFTSIQNNQDITGNPKGGGIHCFGANSEVSFSGILAVNHAQSGGNLYIEDGCFVELKGGSQIKGSREVATRDAQSGGGVMVHDGGELLSNGGASRVIIVDHWADFGGGVYVWGTGRATLLNTFIGRNLAFDKGSGLYAINGGSSVVQVTMDRVDSCPFLISCSEFDSNVFSHSVVYVKNSLIQLNRTIIESSDMNNFDIQQEGLIYVESDAKARLSHVNFLNNDINYLLVNFGDIEAAHITAVGNSYDDAQDGAGDAYAWANFVAGDLHLQNSIWQDTQGGISFSSFDDIAGKCNLVDVVGDWPSGSFVIGTADFNNPAGGDSRQLSSSDGVDMCQADTFAWNVNRDIENQVSPVNESTNPQGAPGEAGGLYDAGFDEVYDNIGDDEFLLTVQNTGSGQGTVVSAPLGIACGTDCTEVYFNGTLVTLFANASAGSEFIGWSGCPLVDGSDNCLTTITANQTIFVEFQPDDLIFSSSFE